jgi:hypothetical protein
MRYEIVDWINLTRDSVQCRDLVNTAMKLGVPENMGNFLTSFLAAGFSKEDFPLRSCSA